MYSNLGANDFVVYKVIAGDTLAKIAARYGTTWQKLAQDNMIADPNKIEVGQEIMISQPIAQSVIQVAAKMPIIAKSAAIKPIAKAPIKSSTPWMTWFMYGGLSLLAVGVVFVAIRSRRVQTA